MPAIAGTSFSSCAWFDARIAPPAASSARGSTKLKNAALGLRQNSRRSRRYCRHASVTASLIGRQFQVHVLERRSPDRELREHLAALERLRRELVQQYRRLVGLE